MNISIVLPAKNEAKNITAVLQSIQALDLNAEVLVINDGSTDNTAELAELAGAKVISHPYSQGNGQRLKLAQEMLQAILPYLWMAMASTTQSTFRCFCKKWKKAMIWS